jgi:hypothetical protein
MDICIQIGNTDNRLSQQKWSEFCDRLYELCDDAGFINFAGGAPTNAPWQNYCICLCTFGTTTQERLLQYVTELRKEFNQDSVAWLQGHTQFI